MERLLFSVEKIEILHGDEIGPAEEIPVIRCHFYGCFF
jgi:hypothetical protein